MSELDSSILKHVLKNAFDYGKANPSSVIGKVIAECPDCKKDMKGTMRQINEEINRVSKLSKEQIKIEMSTYEYTEKKEEKKILELPAAQTGKVITRFPPEPSGYPHIGHAKAAWLDYESARVYGGYMILRFDDTNPEKESHQYVEAIRAGLDWLGIEWTKESYTSDNMPKIYDAAIKLIQCDSAYVCTCSQDKISKGRTEGKACSCRELTRQDHLKRWNDMQAGGFDEGEAILRFSGDLQSQNTVMRDPTLARIITTKHFRQLEKYRIWPSYDLAVCIMDHIEDISHSMRSKEYELRDELYLSIFKALDWPAPQLIGFSRLSIKNAPVSKRLLLPFVNEKKVMGWDDPRLPTLKGLERRGILPAAIKEFVLSFGLSKVESEPDWEALLAHNRKLLDPESCHYFFVPDPVPLEVERLGEKILNLRLHPKKDLGTRQIQITKELHIPKTDAIQIEQDEIFRLKDLCNVKLVKKTDKLVGEVVPEGIVDKKLQWIGKDRLDCEVLIPKDLLNDANEYNPNSLEKVRGYCEKGVAALSTGSVVQFERFGFCRLDKKEPLTFIFSC